MDSSSGRQLVDAVFVWFVFHVRLLTEMHEKTYHTKTACANCPPHDEPLRFETTCRRCQKSN
jgi:hypothetical protein